MLCASLNKTFPSFLLLSLLRYVCLCCRFYFRSSSRHETEMEKLLLAFQVTDDIVAGRFPINRDLALELASLMAQVRLTEMFYLTTRERERNVLFNKALNTFYLRLYGVRTILIVRKENCCRHIGYSYRLTARVLLYAPSHRQDNTYHGLCYTSRGAGKRNSSMGPPHEGSIRRPIAP